jgi:hypothetical protein
VTVMDSTPAAPPPAAGVLYDARRGLDILLTGLTATLTPQTR